uniref:Magnesium transporter n=1 Tax=Chrysotila carterae TaxID=13221 RepID=A0A7S4EVW7_CHRCT|mmetsp:Transcript_29279/g.61539  ORF Transcript_29279/g.61539 Transcript_29279/m.61539 type:complete len:368 (+) Transcript_29279:147-1250(+)
MSNAGAGQSFAMSSDTHFHAARLQLEQLAGSAENAKGVTLALTSSLFIGASFIIKKKGLMYAGQSGLRASAGGYSYLRQPLWWVGLLTMIGGESANFAAYAYAPAILVTPLGATTIVASAIFARCFLGERMHSCGAVGCALCVLGGVLLVHFAPEEKQLTSVEEIWEHASQPVFVAYSIVVVMLSLLLMYRYAPRYGKSMVWVYVLICSLVGSLSVVALRALGIAIKLTLRGSWQIHKKETYLLVLWVLLCIATQMNYLNKALDTFNTTMVSSVYYVFFTLCTVTASMIMYKDWENQTANTIGWQMIALLVLVLGVHVLSATKDSPPGCGDGLRVVLGRASRPQPDGYTLCSASEDDDIELGGASKK